MSRTVYKIMSVILLLTLTLGSYSSAGASSAPGVVNISTPTVYDCKNGTTAGMTIKNTHDVTIKNCNIVVTSANGIQVTDSYNVIIDNVDIKSTYPEGSGINLESTASGLTHDVTISNFHIHGAMGWGIVGSNAVLKGITVRNGLIEDIGQAGGQQKHGMYINNWQTFLVEDVTVLRSWNTGVKIVGDTTDGTLRRVTIKDSGRDGSSGPGISLGDSRVSHMARLTFEYCDIQNSINPAIWILETVNSVNDITVDHCYFKNNYYAVQIPKGATGWRVTNNIGYNQSSYVNARMPLQLEGTVTDIANNFFDFNNWYYDGASPVRVGGTTLSFTQWQAKGADQHSVSLNPNLATATPLKLPTVTLTPIPATVAPAITASSIPASRTPTASSIPVLPSATPQPTLPSLATSTTVPGGSTSLDIRVTSGGDDVEESSTGSMSINSSDLELTYDNNTQLVGIRFKGVNIPKNATILNAYIQFKVNEVNSEATSLTIQGEASPNAMAFSSTTRNVSSRLRTTNGVTWTPVPWVTMGTKGTDQRTPNLAAVIQKIVSQTNWASGNSLVTIITGAGWRVAESYEDDPAGAPMLHIEYSVGTSQVSTLTPVLTAVVSPTPTKTAIAAVTNTNTPTATASPVPVLPSATLQPTLQPASPTLPAAATPITAQIVNTSLDIRVSSGSDDVEEGSAGNIYIDSSDLELTFDNDTQAVGIRFKGLNIPKNATILKAYIQFKVNEVNSEATSLTIQGEASPNAAAFTNTSRNVSSRSRTANAVTWTPAPWVTMGAKGTGQQTPNIAAIIQEIVNQSNWASGNSLVTIITGTGWRVAESYENDSAGAPMLHIEYSIP